MLLNGLGHPVPLIAACVLAVLAAPVALVLWRVRTRSAVLMPGGAAALRRETALVGASSLPLAVGLIVVAGAAIAGPQRPITLPGITVTGWIAAVTPLLGLAAALLIHGLGEAIWPRPAGQVRQAVLSVRTGASVATESGRAVAFWFIGLLAVCAGLALSASGGRSVARLEGYTAYIVDPFPGWLWTGPIALAATVVVVLLRVTCRVLAARPAVPGVPHEWDLWLRRETARRLARITQLLLGLTMAGLLTVAGSSVHLLGRGFGLESGAWGTSSAVYLTIGMILHVVSVAVAVLAVVAVLRPIRDDPPLLGQAEYEIVAGART